MSRFVAHFWFSYPSFSKITYNACMWYVEYICDVPCGVNEIWSSSTTAALSKSALQIKIYSSEFSQPLTNTTLSYGTLFINGSYLFLLLVMVVVQCFFFHSGNIKSISFSTIFTFNIKTIKIQNPCMNLMARRIEMAVYAVRIYLINFSHMWNGTTCSNATHWRTRLTFVPIQYIYSTTWWNFGTTATKMCATDTWPSG